MLILFRYPIMFCKYFILECQFYSPGLKLYPTYLNALPFLFAAISDYRQSLQFQNLSEEKRNIHLEVCLCGIVFDCGCQWLLSLYLKEHICRLLEVAEELMFQYMILWLEMLFLLTLVIRQVGFGFFLFLA